MSGRVLGLTSVVGTLLTVSATASICVSIWRRARCADDQAVTRVGIHWATEQCRDLLHNHVRGIHFYTLNRSDATRKIYENLGVKDSAALRVS